MGLLTIIASYKSSQTCRRIGTAGQIVEINSCTLYVSPHSVQVLQQPGALPDPQDWQQVLPPPALSRQETPASPQHRLILVIPGKFAEWTEWSSCAEDCKGDGLRKRSRNRTDTISPRDIQRRPCDCPIGKKILGS